MTQLAMAQVAVTLLQKMPSLPRVTLGRQANDVVYWVTFHWCSSLEQQWHLLVCWGRLTVSAYIYLFTLLFLLINIRATKEQLLTSFLKLPKLFSTFTSDYSLGYTVTLIASWHRFLRLTIARVTATPVYHARGYKVCNTTSIKETESSNSNYFVIYWAEFFL